MGDPRSYLSELVYEDLEDVPFLFEDVAKRVSDVAARLAVPPFSGKLDSIANSYLYGLAALEFDLWVRPGNGDGDAKHLRVVFKCLEADLGIVEVDGGDIVGRDHVVANRAKRGGCRSEYPVLVFIVERGQDRQGVSGRFELFSDTGHTLLLRKVGSLVRLTFFDEFEVAGLRARKTSSSFGFPILFEEDDRELCSSAGRGGTARDDLPSEMIERGPGVMGELPDEDSPLGWNRSEEAHAKDVLVRRTRLVLAEDRIRLLCQPGFDLKLKRLKVRVCPVQLQPEAV